MPQASGRARPRGTTSNLCVWAWWARVTPATVLPHGPRAPRSGRVRGSRRRRGARHARLSCRSPAREGAGGSEVAVPWFVWRRVEAVRAPVSLVWGLCCRGGRTVVRPSGAPRRRTSPRPAPTGSLPRALDVGPRVFAVRGSACSVVFLREEWVFRGLGCWFVSSVVSLCLVCGGVCLHVTLCSWCPNTPGPPGAVVSLCGVSGDSCMGDRRPGALHRNPGSASRCSLASLPAGEGVGVRGSVAWRVLSTLGPLFLRASPSFGWFAFLFLDSFSILLFGPALWFVVGFSFPS